jgi:hypothetical protein
MQVIFISVKTECKTAKQITNLYVLPYFQLFTKCKKNSLNVFDDEGKSRNISTPILI